MNDTTVHLAGNTVTIGSRMIQRCLICGYKLNDIDFERVAIMQTPGCPTPSSVRGFEVGHLIEVSGTNPVHFADIGDTHQPSFNTAWENCCIHLVE